MRLTEAQDAYGRALMDWFLGRGGYEVAERDDGFIGLSMGPQVYLAEHRDWPSLDKRAVRLARGRVLDVGCGGGRVALHLLSKGLEVVGVDVSPLSVEVCHRRGFDGARLLPFEQVSRRRLGVFDTVVFFGNNFGLMGGRRRAAARLRRLHGMTTDRARLIAQSMDPYGPDAPAHHLEYHERNRRRGRMGGQIRLRIRYQKLMTPWFDYLFVSRAEMEELAEGTGWRISRVLEDEGGGPYFAVLTKGW